MLTEAKKEDERKRATLLGFYERTDVCLQKMDEKVHALLEQNIRNLKEKNRFPQTKSAKKRIHCSCCRFVLNEQFDRHCFEILVSPTFSHNRVKLPRSL